MASNRLRVDSRTLVVCGLLTLVVTAVLLSVGLGGNQSLGYAGPPIAASGVLVAAFALLGFD